MLVSNEELLEEFAETRYPDFAKAAFGIWGKRISSVTSMPPGALVVCIAEKKCKQNPKHCFFLRFFVATSEDDHVAYGGLGWDHAYVNDKHTICIVTRTYADSSCVEDFLTKRLRWGGGEGEGSSCCLLRAVKTDPSICMYPSGFA